MVLEWGYYVDWESMLILTLALSIIGIILSKKISVGAVDWILVCIVMLTSYVFDWQTLECIVEDGSIDAAIAILMFVCVPIAVVNLVNLTNFKMVK